MPAHRSAMRKIKEVLRLKFEANLSHRQIAAATGLSKGAVTKYLARAAAVGIGWPWPADLEEEAAERRIFSSPAPRWPGPKYVLPDYAGIHQELKRKGVTLQLLWEEYERTHGERAYRYSQFCLQYHQFRDRLARSMRQLHRAGEKLFIDYSGDTRSVIDGRTGEIREAQIFVCVLGASNYAYVEATWTQTLPDWIASHGRAFEFFGAVPALLVPDNLKSAIAKACRYEPEANSTYADLAQHYGCAILPARPHRPKDKAPVEAGVLLVQRWVLARLRHRQFFSLGELNSAIRELNVDLNARPFKKLPGSRASAFAALDLPAMKPLPASRYEFAEWPRAKVNIDYHVEVDHHFYSVPHPLVHETIQGRLTGTTLECFHKGRRVAVHVRSALRGKFTTLPEHMPSSHRRHREWTASRLLHWGEQIGPGTRAVVQWQFDHRPHPEQGYRACLGEIARRFGEARLEAACRRALALGSPTRKRIVAILEAKLDQHPDLFPVSTALPAPAAAPTPHANVRGADYYRAALEEGTDEPCSVNKRSIH
jgi:transposase